MNGDSGTRAQEVVLMTGFLLCVLSLPAPQATAASWAPSASPKEGWVLGWARSDVDPSRIVMTRYKRIAYSTDWGRTWANSKAPSSLVWGTSQPKRPVFQPGSAEIVHVAAGGGGYLRSTDGGATFARSEAVYSWVEDIVPDPVYPDRLYLASEWGLYRSTDTGLTWQQLRAGIVDSVAVRGPEIFVGARRSTRLGHSTDAGASWLPAVFPVSDYYRIYGIALHPTDPNDLWISYSGLMHSTDRGLTFVSESAGLTGWPSRDVLTHPLGTVAGSGHGPHRWDATARRWRRPDSLPAYVNSFAWDSVFQAIVASTTAGMLVSADGGFSWPLRPTGLPAPVWALSGGGDHPLFGGFPLGVFRRDGPDAEPAVWSSPGGDCLDIGEVLSAGEVVLASSGCGLRRSSDGGATWGAVVAPSDWAGPVYRFWQDPVTPANVLAATGWGLLRSTDLGLTWSRLGNLEYIECVTARPSQNVVLAGAYFGYFRSTDGGGTWTTDDYASATDMAFDPHIESRVVRLSASGYFEESWDSGQTFRRVGADLPWSECWEMFLDPQDGRIVYVSSWDGPYRSVDGGVSWWRLLAGLPEDERAQTLYLTPETGGARLYAATTANGIFELPVRPRSADLDGDGSVSAADAGLITRSVFEGQPAPAEAFDMNGDGVVGPADPLYLAAFIAGGPPPVASVAGDRGATGSWPAADRVNVESVSARPGTTVEVPVRVVDVAGSPLGRLAEGWPYQYYAITLLQAFSLDVEVSPAGSVSGVAVEKGGLVSTLAPRWESRAAGTTKAHWIASFPDSSPIPWTTAPGGDALATVRVTLAPDAPAGTSVRVRLVPERTCLLNAAGTLAEGCGDGALTIVDGRIGVGTWFGDANRDGVVDVFDVVLTMAYIVGNAPAGAPPLTAEAAALDVNPLASPGVDVQDALLIMGFVVGNVPSLPQ